MKTTRTDRESSPYLVLLLALGVLVAGGLLGACAGDPAGDEEPMNEATEESAVEYEPAYPDDVSADALSEEDAAQQETHTHADGTSHDHGEEDDHEHDGDDDHDH